MTYVGHSASARQADASELRGLVPATPRPGRPPSATSSAAYVALTKPRIIELLLLTTVPVMFFAAQGVPPLGLVVATVVGGTLSAGRRRRLNCVVDPDIDEQMRRTRRRALPRHMVHPARPRWSSGWCSASCRPSDARVLRQLALGRPPVLANAFYVLGYTMILKRRTTQNIVWGGRPAASRR